jgi:pimeloyl-ACP methyl ester carboxylesterase
MVVEDRRVELRGSKFHYRDWGNPKSSRGGMPIVLLHGLASQSHIFDLLAPLLAKLSRVVALDQRGHGESDAPDDGYGFASVGADLAAFLDAVGFKRAIIVGHSWGGNVALEFAATHPNRAAALVLIDGGFLDMQANPKMTWAFAEKRLAPPRLAGTPVEEFREMIKGYLGAVWNSDVERIILCNFEILPDQTIRPHLSFEHHIKILRALWEQRPPALYPRIKCPVLLLPAQTEATSADERSFRDAKRQAVGAAQRGLAFSETVWFNETVHDVPLQRPRKLADTITRFLLKHKLVELKFKIQAKGG